MRVFRCEVRMDAFDIIILGAGSAGFAAARTAAVEFGARVALVDKGPLGGLCILAGCMPSKTLLASSNAAHALSKAATFGLALDGWHADFQAIMARKNRIIEGFAAHRREGIAGLPNTELIEGTARFVGPREVQVGDRRLSARKIILALGSAPLVPPVPGLKEAGYLLSDQALSLPSLPASLLVLGGGVIALELGQFFARLGTRVTIVEAAPRLVAREDEDVSRVIEARLKREGIAIHTGAKPLKVEAQNGRKVLHVEDAERGPLALEAEELLVATGREPAVHDLGLDAAGVQMEGRRMVLSRCLRTTNPDIFAAGDVSGLSNLVHLAVAEGELAARNALRGCSPTPAPENLFISAAFTEPNIARVGLSESEARALGRPVLVGRYDFAEHGKAEILDETDGFVKLLADPLNGELVGATIVGPDGAELIHELACAITLRATVEQFLRVPHIHPTLAEILTYPAEDIVAQMRKLRRGASDLLAGGYQDAVPN